MLVKSQVKYIQSLSQKKLRDQEGVFIAEGPKIINELLASTTVELFQLFALEVWILNNQPILDKIDSSKISVITPAELIRISTLISPNEVLGIFKKPLFNNLFNPVGKITILLDGIQDPGNLGTIIRCADWFGINQVVCAGDCADVFNTKVVQSTMGSISRVRVLYEDGTVFLEAHPQIPVFAAVLEGTSIYELPKITEGIILIGNESKGIRSSYLTSRVQRFTIPRRGKAESLNASVATGIILSHLT